MKTIICITTKDVWEESLKKGQFTSSTITSTLADVGYIHATSPDQTIAVIQRFTDKEGVILLLIDVEKVLSPIKFEPAPSGRPGLFPHIYGPLNTDAVYKVVELVKNSNNEFVMPKELSERSDMTMQKKSFSAPDQTMTPPKAKVEIVKLSNATIMRDTFEPGWKWSVDIGPTAGTTMCQMHHVLCIISGNLKIVMDSGEETNASPGDVVDIPPGHDAWVMGDEAVVGFDFAGANS